MEVFISGLPKRETEKSLNNFMEDILDRLKIEDWSCEKRAQKDWAKLFFLNYEEGLRFLSLHRTNLRFKGTTLNCKISHSTDKFALQSLKMDKEARAEAAKMQVKSKEISSKKEPRVLACTAISCGLWDYIGGEAVFKPYFTLTESAKITFQSKSTVFRTDTSRRLDIIYNSIEAVTWEGLPTPAITFTLREAPRFFHSSYLTFPEPSGDYISPISKALASLELFDRIGPERNRMLGLSGEHNTIAGSCLVYRLSLAKNIELSAQMKALSQIRGISSTTRRHIGVSQPSESYDMEFNRLQKLLSPTSSSLPFAIKFQMQKLAQNGYLPASKVIALLPEIKNMASRSGKSISVNAIRKLILQIPYAGPDADYSYFQVDALVKVLRTNEETLIHGGLYHDNLKESDQVAVIHKVVITPAGIYLYGPERESNNRVLRKYPNHHDNFVRAQFSDEDGQPVYFNVEVSNKPIFDRFRKVLNDGIYIAGQHFSFLGFSHSSLRSQSCWLMAPFIHNGSLLYDRQLIKGLGNFSHIQIPARCAARIGQAFSNTRDAISLAPGVVKEMPDVEKNERVFSDGVGTISREALEKIWGGLLVGRKEKPTVLQIRYQGTYMQHANYVITVDTNLFKCHIYSIFG